MAEGGGGIAAVARMTARVLVGLGTRLDILSFLDHEHPRLGGSKVRLAGGSKIRYFLATQNLICRNHLSIYDSLGTARAHPHLLAFLRPYSVWMHGVEVWEGMRPAYLRSLKHANLVFVNSWYTLERHQDVYGPLSSARVCPLATERDEPPGAMADFSGPPTVLIVGRIDKSENRKGHSQLLMSWPDVVSVVPEARLVIAGGGSGLELMEEQVKQSPVAASIQLKGIVSDEQLEELFRRAYVYAMPSQQEGFGIAYVEAMRFGLPVIASRQDAGQEINADGVTGYNVDVFRKGELTERLIELLKAPNRCATLGQSAHAKWKEQFRFSRFAARFTQIWQEFNKQRGAT